MTHPFLTHSQYCTMWQNFMSFFLLLNFFQKDKPWGFMKDWHQANWPTVRTILPGWFDHPFWWKILFRLWKCVWRQYFQEITNHKLQKHCQQNRIIKWIMTYKPNLKYHDDPSTEGHIFLVTIVMTLCKPNAFYFTYTVIQWDII